MLKRFLLIMSSNYSFLNNKVLDKFYLFFGILKKGLAVKRGLFNKD